MAHVVVERLIISQLLLAFSMTSYLLPLKLLYIGEQCEQIGRSFVVHRPVAC